MRVVDAVFVLIENHKNIGWSWGGKFTELARIFIFRDRLHPCAGRANKSIRGKTDYPRQQLSIETEPALIRRAFKRRFRSNVAPGWTPPQRGIGDPGGDLIISPVAPTWNSGGAEWPERDVGVVERIQVPGSHHLLRAIHAMNAC